MSLGGAGIPFAQFYVSLVDGVYKYGLLKEVASLSLSLSYIRPLLTREEVFGRSVILTQVAGAPPRISPCIGRFTAGC